ncbi:hypothetical protein GOP47_0007473 [Adiantum capillus-veneris]|uniref:Uncharacterized protein n=1 Tax=Adiantum capillus-veneris TaxID=13818 RepID=A0A9D4ZJC0_ADICA|nr:hypothetical protein GOP47_0007473 [Adiantum capillus-veneris]
MIGRLEAKDDQRLIQQEMGYTTFCGRSPYFQNMVSAIASFGKGYKAPNYEKIRTTLLDKEKARICHQLSGGVFFKRSIDTSGSSKTGDFIAAALLAIIREDLALIGWMDKAINEGKEVQQFISNHDATRAMFMEKQNEQVDTIDKRVLSGMNPSWVRCMRPLSDARANQGDFERRHRWGHHV